MHPATAAAAALLSLYLAAAAAAQPAPRQLFPPPAAAAPSEGSIAVVPLPPPAEASLGLATAAAGLRGPLWPDPIPPELPALVARLPAATAEPVLHALQRDLLAAPTPTGPGARELLLARLDRLLAMAEPQAALDILALVPEGREGDAVEALRLRAQFAADRADEVCGSEAVPEGSRAHLVCAALAGDAQAVERTRERLAGGGEPVDPDFAALARASAAARRARVTAALPDDSLLLPLLRRMKLDIGVDAVRVLPQPAKRALLANQNVSAAVRAAAAGPARAGPSVRPVLNGTPPVDWAAAFASVAPARREAWAALADGLGLVLPETLWSELAAAPEGPPSPAPELAAWRGFELARARGERGPMLLHLLLLLDGRPEDAAPVTLRRVLDGLVSLDLRPEARALAAGTGGVLGL